MTMVNPILKQRPAVSQPPRKFLVRLFSPILALRGRVNVRHLSRYGDDAEGTLARPLRRVCDWSDFPQRVITTALDPQAEVISAQDASCIPKSGQQTVGWGHFCHGGAGRAERGLEIATGAVVAVTHRGAVTLAVAQTPPTWATATTPDQEATRGDVYTPHLRAQQHRLPVWGTSHAVDGYVAKKQDRDAVVDRRRHPITPRRGAAAGRFRFTGPHPPRRGAHRTDDGKVRWQDVSRVEALGTLAEAAQVPLSTALVWQVTRTRKRRVVILLHRQAPDNARYLVLASTDLARDGHKRLEWYGARVQIEWLFRDRQPFTGLTDCQARAEAARSGHGNAARATRKLVRAEDLHAQSGDAPRVFSMARWKPGQCTAHVLDFLIEQ